eukprot:TRINITY_DN6303_c0_g1_i1.p1 TRINITY_DN6303_c0_g1~~TRINITY_DN6303_c0_g1_i1.p1  ORF type:complete len:138 (-),score=35.94 TRINITY_DN6303_c0_g1_i1:50-463(-)
MELTKEVGKEVGKPARKEVGKEVGKPAAAERSCDEASTQTAVIIESQSLVQPQTMFGNGSLPAAASMGLVTGLHTGQPPQNNVFGNAFPIAAAGGQLFRIGGPVTPLKVKEYSSEDFLCYCSNSSINCNSSNFKLRF